MLLRFINPQRGVTKILYIEDTENNRILISRRLAQDQYQVITAENAAQGMAVARAEMPALILMIWDCPMSMAGAPPANSKTIRSSSTFPSSLTAHVMHGDREKALAAGCDDYDTKPFHFVRLLNKIEALLAARSAATAANERGPKAEFDGDKSPGEKR